MQIRLANPRGFCAGVERAIRIVEIALERFGSPIYVRHEIVHNRLVVDSLRRRGVVFVDSPADVPPGEVLIFSAHGVSPAVRDEAIDSGLRVIDATCPLVTKVHLEAQRFAGRDKQILLVGHDGHVEVEGTIGEAPDRTRLIETVEDALEVEVSDPREVAVLTQTTLSVDDTADVIETLKARFPEISAPGRSDICYATQNRQDAVKQLAKSCEFVIVVGSANSSNGMRLVECAARMGARVERVDEPRDVRAEWFQGVERVGITAGAAVPEELVQSVVRRVSEVALGPVEVESTPAVDEGMRFRLPTELA